MPKQMGLAVIFRRNTNDTIGSFYRNKKERNIFFVIESVSALWQLIPLSFSNNRCWVTRWLVYWKFNLFSKARKKVRQMMLYTTWSLVLFTILQRFVFHHTADSLYNNKELQVIVFFLMFLIFLLFQSLKFFNFFNFEIVIFTTKSTVIVF